MRHVDEREIGAAADGDAAEIGPPDDARENLAAAGTILRVPFIGSVVALRNV